MKKLEGHIHKSIINIFFINHLLIIHTYRFLPFKLRKYLELIKLILIQAELGPTEFSIKIFNKCVLNVQIFPNVERVINLFCTERHMRHSHKILIFRVKSMAKLSFIK